MSKKDIESLKKYTKSYSFADINAVVKDAAMGPIRDIKDVSKIDKNQVRPVTIEDFKAAFKKFSPSVSQATINEFLQWQKSH